MSLRRLFSRRQPVPFAEWGWKINDYRLATDGAVQYAQWLHPHMNPHETPFVVKQAEVDALRQWIGAGDFAIDVGAHCGDTAVPMALAAGNGGCVLALEPNRYAYAVLEQNSQLNPHKTHIEPRCYAATSEDGEFEFLYGDPSFCNGGLVERRWNPWKKKFPLAVQGRNLLHVLRKEFAFWLPRLRYVKVDAEGHDLSILESILPVLREFQPVVRTEVFKKLKAPQRFALFDLLASAGYEVHRYAGFAEPRGELLSRRQMVVVRHFDILAVPRTRSAKLAA